MDDRKLILTVGHAAALTALAGGLAIAQAPLFDEERSPRQQRLHRERARQREWERRERKRREAERRERDLRQRIAEGKDDRADKYLHAAARRRRHASATPLPPTDQSAGGGR